ncbi:hypothetical protein E8E13_005453 [Curvularia kusanoi]|uniref:Uncharacterized protein n=1 Tax=Curvularia kusanoi TaxID=90978 RepID=A0A9P4WBE6_CURKU|nr:hypothetical protein E8E13_005453 [Curvularia kusanoi]
MSAPTETSNTRIDYTSIVTATPKPVYSDRWGMILPTVFDTIVTSHLKVYTIESQLAECSSRWMLVPGQGNKSGLWTITSGNYADTVEDGFVTPGYWRNCYPDAPATPAYSPAMCTGRYSLTVINSMVLASPTPALVWQGLCCPTGFVYGGRCQSLFSTPTAVAIALPTPSSTGGGSYGGYASIAQMDAGVALAEPITVYWQSSDLTRFPRAYATSMASYMSVTLESQSADLMSSVSTTSGTTNAPKDNVTGTTARGVSKGAMVVIILSAVVGAALLAGAAFFCLRRRRRQRQRQQQQAFSEQHGAATELPNHSSGFKSLIRGRWRAEMEVKPAPVEIDSGKVYTSAGLIAELEAPVHHPDKDPDQFSFTGSIFETRRADTNEEKRTKEEETTSEEKSGKDEPA